MIDATDLYITRMRKINSTWLRNQNFFICQPSLPSFLTALPIRAHLQFSRMLQFVLQHPFSETRQCFRSLNEVKQKLLCCVIQFLTGKSFLQAHNLAKYLVKLNPLMRENNIISNAKITTFFFHTQNRNISLLQLEKISYQLHLFSNPCQNGNTGGR